MSVKKPGMYDECAEALKGLDMLESKKRMTQPGLEFVGEGATKLNEEDNLSVYKENFKR